MDSLLPLFAFLIIGAGFGFIFGHAMGEEGERRAGYRRKWIERGWSDDPMRGGRRVE